MVERGAPSVALQARLPTSETISIEAEASEEMKNVKQRIASLGGLDVDSFTLTFDGEVVGEDSDGQLIGDLPFGDGSMLEVVVSKKQAALLKLSEMGIEGLADLEKAEGYKLVENDGTYSEVVEMMLDAGKQSDWEIALHGMAKWGLLKCLEVLLTHENVVHEIVLKSKKVKQHIHVASSQGHTSIVKLLLKHGVHVDLRDSHSRTPLSYACEFGKEKTAELLLRHGANPTLSDKCLCGPLHYAAQKGTVVELILSQRDVNVNAKSDVGVTALHQAVLSNSPAVSLLLKHGADMKMREYYGHTALHIAAQRGHTNIVNTMMEHNKECTKQLSDRGFAPLHDAAIRGFVETAAVLICHGSDVDFRDKSGRTALYHAASAGDRDMTALLLHHGANVHAKDNYGASTLEIECSNQEVIDLLKSGA